MLLEGNPVTFQVYSGASTNILPRKHAPSELQPSNKVLVMWNNTQVKPVGCCRMKMINPKNNEKFSVAFDVVDADLTPLLGARASQKLKVNPEIMPHIVYPRRVPDSVKPLVKTELDRLVETDSISPVDQPTEGYPIWW